MLELIEASQGSCKRRAMACDIGSVSPGGLVTVRLHVRLRTLGHNEIRVDFATPEDIDTFNNTRLSDIEVVKRF